MASKKRLSVFFVVLLSVIPLIGTAHADPDNISIDLSGLNGEAFQLEVALYDNSGVIGDSWVLLDDVFFGWMSEDFESGTPGMFDVSLNPASVNAVAGNLNGAGNYVLRIDEDPLVTPTFTFADFDGSDNGWLSFVYDIAASETSGPFGLDELVFSILDPETLEPLVTGVTDFFGDVLTRDASGSGAHAKYTLSISSTVDGSVVTPGEGQYEYVYYDSPAQSTVPIKAVADDYSHRYGWTDNIAFYEWTGTAVDAGKVADPSADTTTVLVDADYTLVAKFVRTPTVKTLPVKEVLVLSVNPPKPLFRGLLDKDGGAPCQTRFKYWQEGATNEYTPWGTAMPATCSFSKLMKDLEPGAMYHVVAQAQNPAGIGSGESLAFTVPSMPELTLSSSLCGSVSLPDEGVHKCLYEEVVPVEAVPMDEDSVFLGWSGTAVDAGYVADVTAMTTTVYVDSTLTLHANFGSLLDAIYVGASDPCAPEPDGSQSRPWHSVQDAIDVAAQGATIIVGAGYYEESLDLGDKQLQVIGQWLMDANDTGLPIIASPTPMPGVTINGGQDANCVLAGLSLSGGLGAGLLCDQASPTLLNCLISGNLGAGMVLQNSMADIINCTVVSNGLELGTAGLVSRDSLPSCLNSVFWDNMPANIQIQSGDAGIFSHCLVQGGVEGDHIIDMNPRFALDGFWDDNGTEQAGDDSWVAGDYHSQSEAGRWNPIDMIWMLDAATSPLIDAADPSSDASLESEPNGDLCNLGVFGGTAQASRSSGP